MLTSDSSAYGDWKHIKYEEYISRGLKPPYSELEMNDYYKERDSIRLEINNTEDEIKRMDVFTEEDVEE